MNDYSVKQYHKDSNVKPTTALVLGILSLIFWIIPLLGLPISIVGLIMGIMGGGNKSGRPNRMAKAGLLLSFIGLILVVINVVVAILYVLRATA